MSHYPPHQPPHQPPNQLGQPPRKPRPRVVWFVVGGTLLLLAPIVFAAALFATLRPLTQSDGVFPADGAPHQVTVDAGERRAIFVPAGGFTSDCTVVDGSDQELTLRPVQGTFTTTSDGQEFSAVARFESGDGQLTITCAGLDQHLVRIGQIPSAGSLFTGIGIGIAAPIVLGTTGLIILIVTGILFATRPPRRPV